MWHSPKTSYGLTSPSSSENATPRSGDGNGCFGSVSMDFNAIRKDLAAHTTTTPFRGVFDRDALADRTQDAIRQVMRSADGIGPKDRQLLKDIGRGRYIGGVQRALEISRRCVDPSDATALPDAFRGFVVAVHPGFQVCEISADRAETESNGEFDLAVLEWRLSPSKANGERAIEAGRRQLMRTQQMCDAIERAVVGGVRFPRANG